MSKSGNLQPLSETGLIRKARAEDEAAIKALVHGERLNPLGLNWRRFLVAVDEAGKVIGCGQIKPHRDGSRELASLVVAPEWRGAGLARRLIEALVASSDSELYLTCRSTLGGFYERFGFQVSGEDEMPGYFRLVSRIFGFLQRFTRHEGLLVMRRRRD